MASILLLKWWYSSGWLNAFKYILIRTQEVASEFSISILLGTLFEPWKQIKFYAGQNSSIDAKIQIWADNLFSRFFGFFIRLFIIIIGLLAILLTIIFYTFVALVWPVIPLSPIIFIIKAIGL